MPRTLGSIDTLRALWLAETSSAARNACWALATAGLVAGILLGRLGTVWSQSLAALVVVLAFTPTVLRWMVLRRHAHDPRSIVDATLMRTEPEIARAALRAFALTDQTHADPARGSIELARLHFARVLGRASLEGLGRFAGKTAWRRAMLALLVAGGTLATVVVDPFRIIEGANVLAAAGPVAPVRLSWVELPRLVAEPPSYLSQPRRPLRPYFPVALPSGTSISVHAAALHAGRQLVLTDGTDEVPFRDDGTGAVVAHWTLGGDASLVIAARFGEVLVYEPDQLDVHAIADRSPHVSLEGAPATHRLLDVPRIRVHWEAIDDHGLREVALVLRAGEREDRRALSKPQGGTRIDRGGIELSSDDPFVKKSYLPVELTVEALDNDPVTGAKWGRSAPILLVPPQIGEREALRYRSLARARDVVTDLLALLLEQPAPDLAVRAAFYRQHRKRQEQAAADLLDVARQDFGGLRVRGALASLVRGQVELAGRALDHAAAGAPDGHGKLVARTENMLLAVDSALGATGAHDTRVSAIKLADVATDAASAIELGRDPVERARAVRRLEADLSILEGGGSHLIDLGALGQDLGEIVENGVRRIRRGLQSDDRFHARLAAEDLAARLRMPDPSFGSSGGGHGHGGGSGGGVESGGSPEPGAGQGPEAARDAESVEQALEQLRQEHAAEMEAVERAMAQSPEDRQRLEQQLREQAKAVRDAVSGLPQQASDPESARAAAAQARSQAESMAGSLEAGDLEQAVQHGERAMGSLGRARQESQRAASPDAGEMGELAGNAESKLGPELDKARKMLDQQARSASERAKGELQRVAKRERRLAERAREIGRQSAEGDAPLPQEMLDRLRHAAEAMESAGKDLDASRGKSGLEQQREAQRLLELSQPESDEEPPRGERDGNGSNFAHDADVPPEARDAAADEFRKRVTDGLGRQAPPHLKDAIRRYTEGLLR